MSYFDVPHEPMPRTLPDEQAAYYRRMLATHSDDRRTGQCPVCHVRRCRDWTAAWDVLAAAGEPMATPDRWEIT
jgi:hypothetical protein